MPKFTPQSVSVADLVSRVATDEDAPNEPVYIPSLQREFCWSHTQIEELFDSLLRGLPIGSLLLWEVSGDTASEEATYRFIKHYVEESAYPTERKYENDGRHVRNKSKQLTDSDAIPDTYTFALDGQQRLTSFLIGLRGTYYRYKGQKYKTKLHSYSERQLYLNVLASPSDYDATDTELRYQFKFRSSGENRTSGGDYWWPVHNIWGVDRVDGIVRALKDDVAESAREERAIEANLVRLHEAIYDDDHLLVEHVSEMDSEVALELFVRRNDGGETLSNSDIAFSQMTVYWTSEDQDPKHAIESYVDKLERDWGNYGFGFSKGFIIRSLLMLSDHPPSFRREYLIPENIKDLEAVWLDDAFKQATFEAYRLVTQELGLGRTCLTSNSAILPILYYCYLNLQATGDSRVDPPDRILDRMEYWLSVTVCNNLFTLGSDTVLRRAQDYVGEDSFPVLDILEEFRGRGVQLELTEDRLETLVEETDYYSGSTKHFFLTKAYEDSRISGELVDRGDSAETSQMQVDHIYPQNKLNPDEEAALHRRGLDSDDRENRHQLGNLQLIPENQAKGDTDPGDWLNTISGEGEHMDTVMAEHCLPWPEPDDYPYDRFSEFWTKREKLLLSRLKAALTLHHDLASDTSRVTP